MSSGASFLPTKEGIRAEFLLAPDHVLRRVQRTALIAAVVGALGCVLGLFLDPTQFLRSYLVAFLFWTGLAVGALAILMIQHITGGAWGAVIRRLLEAATRTLPLMAVLFLVLVPGLGTLYEWADPQHVAHDAALQHKAAYLNVPFFLGRAVFYFAAWIVLAFSLARWSEAQDRSDDANLGLRMELLSRGGLLLLGLTVTFASIDWVMSLEPHWYSTIYGILFAGGAVLTAMSFVIPVLLVIGDRPPLAEVVTSERFHDLGKLLLAFIMLWAYFSFSQFLIIWSGNLPEETTWYMSRLRGGWQWVGLLLIVVHFVFPFLILLSRDVKRRPRRLAVVALGLLVLRFVDLYWLVTPAFSPEAFAVHWLDLATVVGVGGLWLFVFVHLLASRPLIPLNDPALAEAEAPSRAALAPEHA